MTPSVPSVLAGRPQIAPAPGAPNLITAPKTSLYDPRNAPPEDPFLKSIKAPLQRLVGEQIRPSVSMEKIWMNAAIRRAHYYWEGQQYLTLAPSPSSPGLFDYRPIAPPGSSLSPTANYALEQFNDYVLNIFRGDIRKFVAVIGTRAPNVQARTRDPNDQDQTILQRLANRVAAYLDSHWDVDSMHRELTHYLALYGNAFTYVRHVADKGKYGTSKVPLYTPVQIPNGEPTYRCLFCATETPLSRVQASGQVDARTGFAPMPLCPRCGQPLGPESLILPESIPGIQLTEWMEYENGAVECDLVNRSMVTDPFWAKSVDCAPWWIYEFEMDKGRLAQIFPELKSKIYRDTYGFPFIGGDGTGISNFQTRQVLQSPMSVYNYAWARAQYLYTRCWLPPSTIEYLPGDDSGAQREQLLSKFPSGILAHYVNGELCRAEEASLAHDWAVFKAEPSETIYCQPYFQDYIQGQDHINDAINNLAEAAQRVNGLVIFDPDVLDTDRIREYATQALEFLPARPGQTGNLQDAFFRGPGAELNAALKDWIDWYIGKLREISGIRPEIFGGGDAPTARQGEMNRNQALMQLNTPWMECRKGWAQTYDNAVWHIAKFSQDGRLFQKRAQNAQQSPAMIEVPNVAMLADGGWYFEAEEAFPMSIGQRRDYYMSLEERAAQNPQIQTDLMLPSNRVRMAEAVGSPDWDVSGVKEREYILRHIHQLGKEKPIMLPPPPPQPPPMPGAPGLGPGPGHLADDQPPPPPPVQPSQPFSWDLFTIPPITPDFVVQVIREWAVDDPGQELMESDPNGGYSNVMAFLAEAVQKATPPPPPPPPPQPAKVSMSISSKDLPPDAVEKVMEDANLLPPNSPPFSSDPSMQQAPPPGPPGGPPPLKPPLKPPAKPPRPLGQLAHAQGLRPLVPPSPVGESNPMLAPSGQGPGLAGPPPGGGMGGPPPA